MRAPPPDLDVDLLATTIRAGWRFEVVSLEYLPVGAGSHHWVAADPSGDRRFVTVDVLAYTHFCIAPETNFGRLRAAFETARRLRDSGLDFVVAPLADHDGRVIRRVGESFSIAVFPYVEGGRTQWGERHPDAQRQAVASLIARVHDATGIADGIAARENLVLPCRNELEVALGHLGRPWTRGPYGERARILLREVEQDLMAALRLYDGLARRLLADGRSWVITHGEPHPGNVIWTAEGARIVDWDTALIAPPARDLWMLERSGAAWAESRSGSEVTADADADVAIVLYGLRWDVSETIGFATTFYGQHDDNLNTAHAWLGLERYARRLQNWSDRLS